MVTIGSLWLAILVSGVIVWIGSFLIWVVLPHHKSEYKGLPDEDATFKSLGDLPPGLYNLPHLKSLEEIKKPEIIKRFEEGPTGFLTVVPRGVPAMGKKMVLSFIYYLLVSVMVAYVAGRTLEAGTHYLAVFRVAGTVAWLAYGWAAIPDAIWFGRPWIAIAKQLIDALAYGLLTAGVFGWLWPR
jgi:hypothetical protein